MAQDRTIWEINRMKKDAKETKEEVSDLDDRVKKLEEFKVSTVEQLKTVLEAIKDIQNSYKWLTRSFITMLGTGTIGSVGSFLFWIVRKALGGE